VEVGAEALYEARDGRAHSEGGIQSVDPESITFGTPLALSPRQRLVSPRTTVTSAITTSGRAVQRD